MANYSPYECDATTGAGSYYDFKGFPSPSPIPSPRGPGYYFDSSTPVRPAARAHFRGQSTSGFQNNYPSPRGPMFSPRYTISGEYATANGGHWFDRDPGYVALRFDCEPRPASHTRHSSTSVPQRPQTARPSSSHKKLVREETSRVAAELDAKRHSIPSDYSLKN